MSVCENYIMLVCVASKQLPHFHMTLCTCLYWH